MMSRFQPAKFLLRRLSPALLFYWLLGLAPLNAETWQRQHDGELTPQAFLATSESDAEAIYICRGHFNKGTHPGQIKADGRGCLLSSAGRAAHTKHYDVLLAAPALDWESNIGDEIPANAVVGGNESVERDRPLYICRGKIAQQYYPGKIRRAVMGCRVAYHSRERTLTRYEVLVERPQTVPSAKPLGFAGQWRLARGEQQSVLRLEENEGRLSGTYAEGQGRLQGFVIEQRLWGQWLENGRHGDIELELTKDGQRLQGRWRYSGDSAWQATAWRAARLADVEASTQQQKLE